MKKNLLLVMLHVVVVCLVSSCHTKYTCNIIDEECIDTVFLLGQKYSPAHLFIDKISGYGQIIPSQSLFDIEITHRLGFNTIELNVHQTSDGMFVCIHGENGTFGQQVKHIDDQTDISNMSISSVPLSYIQDKIRYKSTRSEYQTTIPTLEQCCELCSKLGMSVYLALTGVSRDNSINAINICKKWFGNNFVVCAYGDEQAYYLRSIFKGIIMNWTPTIELSEIEEFIKKIGLPYIHCVRRDNYSNETSDITFKNISSTIHNNGGYAGFSAAYTPESLAQRMWNCGFDIAGPSYNINDFEGGNICQLTSEDNFTAFTTTASVVDGSLLLSETDIIVPDFVFPSEDPFLAGGVLKLCFNGRILVHMGHIYSEFSSDGLNELMLSTYFMSERPSFKIKALSETSVSFISYQASVF